jgi:hypothetical protein
MILKKLIQTLILLCGLAIFSATNSGVKIGLDTNLLKILSRVDLNKHFQNKTLISNETYQKTSFPSCDVHVGEIKVTNLENPQVNIKTDKVTKSLQISLENFHIDLISTMNFKIISILSENLVNSPIKIGIEKIESIFTFVSGEVKVSKFSFVIRDLQVDFSSFVFKTIMKFFKGPLLSLLNSELSKIQEEISSTLNTFFSKENIINVGMGIGMNVTTTDKPDLVFVEKLENFIENGDNSSQGKKLLNFIINKRLFFKT